MQESYANYRPPYYSTLQEDDGGSVNIPTAVGNPALPP
jgi:hypothetical protein